jgi:GNAT superfamily N-acetyltransferase
MINVITFDEIYPIWDELLWPGRVSKIERASAMSFLKGYDVKNMIYHTTFFCYSMDDSIVGVNSGHKCFDNSYRSRGLYVFPSYRGRGIGNELLLATIEQGRKEGSNFVWSYPKQDSWRTYERAGFALASDWEQSETGINAYCKLDLFKW